MTKTMIKKSLKAYISFSEIVIWHAAIDKILKLCRRWEREVSLDQKNLNVMFSSPKE